MSDEIGKFIEALVDSGLLSTFGEGEVIARQATIRRQTLNYSLLVDVASTRAAHKKFGPDIRYGK